MHTLVGWKYLMENCTPPKMGSLLSDSISFADTIVSKSSGSSTLWIPKSMIEKFKTKIQL